MNSTSRLCAPLAGPFQHIHSDNTSAIIWITLTIISIIITCVTRRLVLGYVVRTPPTEEPALTPCARCRHITDAELPPRPQVETPPAPLVPAKPKPTYQEILAADKERLLVAPTMFRFSVCTGLTLANISTLTFLALDIQAFLYCDSELTKGTPITNRQQTTWAIIMWIAYACTVAWASAGILCWPIWARNLYGGEEAARKYPIRTDLGGFLFLGCTLGPPFVVLMVAMAIVIVPVTIAKEIWKGIRGNRAKVVDAAEVGEVESGVGCDSGSVTEVESFTEK